MKYRVDSEFNLFEFKKQPTLKKNLLIILDKLIKVVSSGISLEKANDNLYDLFTFEMENVILNKISSYVYNY